MRTDCSIFKFIITTLALLWALMGNLKPVWAQADTIRLTDKRLMTQVLKPGNRQYLVYFQMLKNKKNLRFWYWIRNTSIENRNGEEVFTVNQHWFGSDTLAYRSVYSVNRTADFAPLYHAETINNKTKAYNWGVDKITGADSVKDNTAKNFSLAFTQPNFNWNLDIETFEMLPLAAGKTFAINFYDAGLQPPAYMLYKVIGSDLLSTLNNDRVDCWKLFTEGDSQGKHYTQTFWISKKGHEFLKEEDTFDGGYRYKIKLPLMTPDLMKRFKQ
ncbi:hypothetical protein SAMN05428975_4735 [Mucilaginibacter sp. OK268]|uniref:DUF3108 domain-containing protein n=1 Tax=Mucilaginibacter sp. OK268 TaxID=1881048 RepID=UPI0008834269|nr:hypothetical protein [Mucilaginibacter sp. OK268]SDP98397.1 hypothetical protein SAMN05428975_4735 [Mucilaginibacter sp. OK268]